MVIARRKISSGQPPVTRRKSSVFISEGPVADENLAYGDSFHKFNDDVLPRMDNYRDMLSLQAVNRPTLDELHDPEYDQKKTERIIQPFAVESGVKFGWVRGVFIRCILNIWGVMLFLRLTWMVGESGIIQSMAIILMSTIVTTITTLSMSAASTNGEIKGGGLYYMISRSLGPEFGGAVGVVFSFANAAMAALNIVGCSEAFIDLLNKYGVKIIDGGVMDNRIYSCIQLVILQSIIIIGMDWEAKAQLGLLVILLAGMGDFVVGAALGPRNDLAKAQGWLGLNGTIFMNNLFSDYGPTDGVQQNFFTVFGIFFPSVTGIQAGVSISGDLRDPSDAIPKGTLLAIFVTSASYALFACIGGAGSIRGATGNVTQLKDGSFAHCPYGEKSCAHGLLYDYFVMGLMSYFWQLIYAGCFAACLSSALSCLVSGPKTFQALCKDKVYPYVSKCGIGYGKSDDPYWGYAAGFVIALIFILIGDLNTISPLVSNFFMAAYALLNYCAFHAYIIKPLGWRPTFKYCNAWISLSGVILCVVVMFLLDWVSAIISLAFVVILYAIVLYRKPELNWGTSVQAQTYSSALSSLQHLVKQTEHAKNYRPQILCLSGFPSNRPELVEFADLITKGNSLLICANINEDHIESKYRRLYIQRGYDWLRGRKIKGFHVMLDGCKFDDGCQALLQSIGIGKVAPNILLMGYKTNWSICHPSEVREYFNCLHMTLDNHLAIAILRFKDGLDISDIYGHTDLIVNGDGELNGDATSVPSRNSSVGRNPRNHFSTEVVVGEEDASPAAKRKGNKIVFKKKGQKGENGQTTGSSGVAGAADSSKKIDTVAPSTLSFFQTKQSKGTIDVYWLYDDGGLTLLLPYIITTRKKWSQCNLRVFALANKPSEADLEHRNMAALLAKFRIDYSALNIIPDITKRADTKTKELFASLIKDYTDIANKDDPDYISEAELLGLKEKTNRHLRLRELLLQHSARSNLIVMTLPVPRKGVISAFLYMAWLEILTKDMPPFLLVRGNQASVLTFYS